MIDICPIPLEYACDRIGEALDINSSTLIAYAREDPHGGYHASYDDGFPVGSMWRVEGQVLYALVRALKPLRVLELGTARGCSATHILQALHDNDYGTLSCIDNNIQPGPVADYVPDHLRGRMTLHITTIEHVIERFIVDSPNDGFKCDMVLDDGMHDAEQVALIWGAAEKMLRPGGVILSHDACHALVGHEVQAGIALAGYADKVLNVLIAPADCGFAIWRKGL